MSGISNVKSVTLDSCIWIYFIEKDEKYYDIAKEVINYLISNKIQINISAITWAEVLPKAMKGFDKGLVQIYKKLFESIDTLKWVDVDYDISFRSAYIRSLLKLKTPDAIHIATAVESSSDIFITNDMQIIKKKDWLGVKLLSLKSFLAQVK